MDAITLAHYGEHAGWWWPIFPLLWFIAIVAVISFFGRRAKRRCGGYGRYSGESVLAERYARGEISETEYRDRLGVLRGNNA